ncbi:unnamed protein product [Allacma fusca]|uniref:LIM and SH3 domain protein Lasp n=1 Tax=Allacma fusca TaxID=39272 RepID=A0A8J2P5V4_9HEXA|nr:unnamed protein product [Allacma fusca]
MPQCSRCNKSVYPLEELKCLDKVWHKGCFRCSECDMTLNMKTYKGFNKLPYCEAHIPKAKATTVAETPELKRIQENTKIQSNAAYHAEFEKSKGKFTPVVDDPELLRIKQNTRIISMVAYHGDLEKKALMEQKRVLSGEGGDDRNGFAPPKSPSYMDELASLPTRQPTPAVHQPQQKKHHQPPEYNPPPSTPSSQQYNRNSANNYHEDSPSARPFSQSYSNHLMTSPYSTPRPTQNVIYSSELGAVNPGSPRKSGRMASGYGHSHQQPQYHPQQPQHQQPPQQQQQQYRNPPQQQPNYGVCYRALYDYEAQDNDEISFADGDLIIDCTAVEEGWMTGTVQRTGNRGMLPANYLRSIIATCSQFLGSKQEEAPNFYKCRQYVLSKAITLVIKLLVTWRIQEDPLTIERHTHILVLFTTCVIHTRTSS